MSVFKQLLNGLRDDKQVGIAKETIKWHGKLANAILSDMVDLARDLPENTSAKKALAFVAKKIAPTSTERFSEYNKWVKEVNPPVFVEEIIEAVPAEVVTTPRIIINKNDIKPRRRERR